MGQGMANPITGQLATDCAEKKTDHCDRTRGIGKKQLAYGFAWFLIFSNLKIYLKIVLLI